MLKSSRESSSKKPGSLARFLSFWSSFHTTDCTQDSRLRSHCTAAGLLSAATVRWGPWTGKRSGTVSRVRDRASPEALVDRSVPSSERKSTSHFLEFNSSLRMPVKFFLETSTHRNVNERSVRLNLLRFLSAATTAASTDAPDQ